MNRNKKQIIIISLILVFSMLIIVGSTFAFLSVTVTNSGISGKTAGINITLTSNTLKRGSLIPTDDSIIPTLLNGTNLCIDARGYDTCSVYQITITNNSTAENLYGYFTTETGTTYTNSNLKYALYTENSGTYTIASDINTISMSTSDKNYFKSSGNNISFSLNLNQTREYYLVIWLSNINENQLTDNNKSYSGVLTFESTKGAVKATFS